MTLFSYIRKKRAGKFIAVFLAINLLAQIGMPTVAMALTGGPTQPETQSFEPAGTSDMVNLFTGDFNYNIPLFDLPGPEGGYPFNMAYHSGIGMDQEASWVGLGWNINPGAINRDKRGLPDDFSGDVIEKELDMAPNVTYGVTVGLNVEIFGGDMDAANTTTSGSLGGSLTIYKNSFKGIGYSLDQSIKFSSDKAALGLGMSLDSQEGVGVNASLSYGKNMLKANPTYGGIGVGFNSQRGLSVSASGRIGGNTEKAKEKTVETGLIRGGGSSTYSFAERAYSPSFPVAMTGINLLGNVKIGGDLAGALTNISVGGFYRSEKVESISNTYRAYGYNYLENEKNTGRGKGMLDFNREKDGMVREETPNLSSPNLTFDTYMATSQGFSGNYRAHRNDVGHLHDPYVESRIKGGAIGVDLGPGYPFELGVQGSVNSTFQSSGDWKEENDFITNNDYNYDGATAINDYAYEKLYYKVKGELTSYDVDELNYIGGETAVRTSLKRKESVGDCTYSPENGILVTSRGPNSHDFKNVRWNSLKRIRRNSSIQPITNEQLLKKGTTEELMDEYKLKVVSDLTLTDNNYALTSYTRNTPPKHNAGFTCVNPDGRRYVYALPAYNQSEEEIAYTYTSDEDLTNKNYVPSVGNDQSYKAVNTEKFFSRTVTPKYAHAYLLTAVLGADYVDLTGNGVTDDDYGYWVKFNYVKTASEFNWRAPYEGGMFLKGNNIPRADDKVMFNYGTKEIWYLASAETKSHIAVFKLSERKDGKSATKKYSDDITAAKSLYKVDEINLYSKADMGASAIPVKTVHFKYNYDLCGRVTNNLSPLSDEDNSNQGKLTLKSVWFTYQNNTRGSLSPYTFDYAERMSPDPLQVPQINLENNPDYVISTDNTNRWGGYRDNTDFFKTRNMPYVSQFNPAEDQSNSTVKQNFKAKTDRNAAVWTLKKIGLPTGGSITVEYESDDYGYVQHRQATQMFQIRSLRETFTEGHENEVYKSGNQATGAGERRIHFKLETPISSLDPNATQTFFDRYLAGLKQEDGTYPMYFRINSDLRNGKHEDITGYCNLEEDKYGVEELEGGSYRGGYITVKLMTGNNSAIGSGTINYHPFAVAAWQFMRTNQPDLLTAFGSLADEEEGTSALDKMAKIKSLGSVIPASIQVFTGYRRYAFNHNWGRLLNLDKSMIRLCSPDRIKFGGGLRVKKIIYSDEWSSSTGEAEQSKTYGQVYTYTTTEGVGANAVTYSSGVAQYEPMIGGDEIALRHPKHFLQSIPFATDNNLFFEYPINESLYPGASVGYSKVTIQSIASKEAAITTSITNPAVSTTGTIVNEFYTAREFPVITDETDNQTRPFNLFIPVPLIGQLNKNKLFATQGYAIYLNNMHGQLKSITNYGKNTQGELMSDKPTSSVTYLYKSELRGYDGQTVSVLLNKVPAIVNESLDIGSGKMECNKKEVIIGEEYDFFTDSRQSHVTSQTSGLNLNLFVTGPVNFPVPWPSVSYNVNDLRTFVTNKIISKTGVLEKVVATDGSSIVTTENKLFDVQTGIPLLTTVTNDFEKPIYTYTHPANWEYDGMGAAAINYNFTFYAKVRDVDAGTKTFTIRNEYSASTPNILNAVTLNRQATAAPYPVDKDLFQSMVAEGDEFIIIKPDGNQYKGTLLANDRVEACVNLSENNILFHCPDATVTVNEELIFTIVRSGRRNMLTTNAGAITGLKDPTDNANRGPSAMSNKGSCLASDIAALMNDLAANNNHTIPLATYPISKEVYPLLGSTFTQVQVGESECSIEAFASQPYYKLTFTYINASGGCETITCLCVAPKIANTFEAVVSGSGCAIRSITTGMGSYAKELDCLNNIVTRNYTTIKDVISSSTTVFKAFSNYDEATYTSKSNLYAPGKKGVWNPSLAYYYKDERVNQPLPTDVKLSHDGVYKGKNADPLQNEFYMFNWKPSLTFPIPSNWVQSAQTSRFNEHSNPVETLDILGLYAGVVYDYNGQLPIIQGKNAKQKELFFESFEEAAPANPALLRYTLSGTAVTTTDAQHIAHTGKKSFQVTSGGIRINKFIPQLKNYTISLWMSQNIQPATYANTTTDANKNVGVQIECYGVSNNFLGISELIPPSGNVIEKWQRIEGSFEPVLNTAKIVVKFNLPSGGSLPYYFDDIRIFPSDASVNTSVYDVTNYRVSAVLDDNNFATIYNYDGEGNLFMTKKETAKGIKTIQETRGHLKEKQ